MDAGIDRRSFLTSAATVAAIGGLPSRPASADEQAESAEGRNAWRLGCQAYTFKEFTFEVAVKKMSSLGLQYVEMLPWQRLGERFADQRTDESMSVAVRRHLKRFLADHGVTLIHYGVCKLPHDEVVARKTFEFAQDLGVETLVAEPAFESLDMIERLCDEYQINVALHNHPWPSTYWDYRYWNYRTILEHCRGRSKRIGACGDTGHWMRCGIEPLEAVKALEGRIISFHFKDLNRYGKFGSRRGTPGADGDAHDVPWGTGAANVEAILAECHRQQLKTVLCVEYGYNFLNSSPEIAQSIEYYKKELADLGAT
jgi:sugar phosphate isomerase/epimerase